MVNVYTEYDQNGTIIGRIRPHYNMHYGYWISLQIYKRLLTKRTIGGIAGIYADHSLITGPILVVDKAFDQVVGCI